MISTPDRAGGFIGAFVPVNEGEAFESSAVGICLLTDHVPHGAFDSEFAWTLKVSVVRGAKLLTIMA